VNISRLKHTALHATRKHFETLIENYQNVQVVNLLSQNPASPEYELCSMYKTAISSLPALSSHLKYCGFDFHSVVKTDQYDQLHLLADALRNVIKEYGYSLISAADSKVIRQQNGVLRTNCLDCLLN
jgi:hypothetical protein